MPRKVRQLKAEAKRAGFVLKPKRGKGSHSVWVHSEFPTITLNISGHDGEDAHLYQEDQLAAAIDRVAKARAELEQG
jgi:predicted RNA binding protein YcfA (HicA-like mRNA interferase family)